MEGRTHPPGSQNEDADWSWGFQAYLGGPCTMTGLGETGREQIHIPGPRRTSCPPTDTGPVCLQAHRIYQCRFSRLIAKATDMLLLNEYVVIISVDFTKAFNRVRHHALSLKYLQLELPDHIHNWLMDYFTGRGHSTRIAGLSSLVARINASIIQGSRLGPSSYVVAASDLHPKHRQNKITKFADDTYMLG